MPCSSTSRQNLMDNMGKFVTVENTERGGILLDKNASKFLGHVLSRRQATIRFRGKEVEKIIGTTSLHGPTRIIFKWKNSGKVEAVSVLNAYLYFESEVDAYYRSRRIRTPWMKLLKIRLPFPTANDQNDVFEKSDKKVNHSPVDNVDKDTKIFEMMEWMKAKSSAIENMIEEDNEDILELTCEDDIDYKTIMTWPSAFQGALMQSCQLGDLREGVRIESYNYQQSLA